MKKLIFAVFVILAFGMLITTCQENITSDQVSQSTGPSQIDQIESCINPPELACGRMTGGGSVFFEENGTRVRVTRGFELHCDVSLPNNLEVNWKGGNNFHLTELVYAWCTDSPDIIQDPPAAPFDTFEGWGYGRLNKNEGAIIHLVFVDAGEPGKNDTALIEIWYPATVVGGSVVGTLVLDVSGYIDVGNLQAHDDKDCQDMSVPTVSDLVE